MASIRRLISVFEQARVLLALPGNDFAWSWWDSSEGALAEIDAILGKLRSGSKPSMMVALFAPTGGIQEVSLSSGWGKTFVLLADRFDAAMSALAEDSDVDICSCPLQEPEKQRLELVLGMDENYAEVSLHSCPLCGQKWLRYFYENEAFTRSGRWYSGAIADDDAAKLQVGFAKKLMEGLDFYFVGGSYFDGRTSRSSGPIHLTP